MDNTELPKEITTLLNKISNLNAIALVTEINSEIKKCQDPDILVDKAELQEVDETECAVILRVFTDMAELPSSVADDDGEYWRIKVVTEYDEFENTKNFTTYFYFISNDEDVKEFGEEILIHQNRFNFADDDAVSDNEILSIAKHNVSGNVKKIKDTKEMYNYFYDILAPER